jgi:cobalamin biosynthesis protein CobD/CbiB
LSPTDQIARRAQSLFEHDSAQTSLASVAGKSGVQLAKTQAFNDGSCFSAVHHGTPAIQNQSRKARVHRNAAQKAQKLVVRF